MFKVDENFTVDATRRGNAARFINHSCEVSHDPAILQRKHFKTATTSLNDNYDGVTKLFVYVHSPTAILALWIFSGRNTSSFLLSAEFPKERN